MSTKTETPASGTPEGDAAGSSATLANHKPRFALFVATACGLGYIPVAPGTFGSLAGVAIACIPWPAIILGIAFIAARYGLIGFVPYVDSYVCAQIAVAIITAVLGLWSANRVVAYARQKDPQYVVVDEVSGQHLTLLVGGDFPVWWRLPTHPWTYHPLSVITGNSALSWKYLVLGFILFRVFDIWKPFPARQAESLPGGWGIMADDWIAGIYAGIGLWIARAAGL